MSNSKFIESGAVGGMSARDGIGDRMASSRHRVPAFRRGCRLAGLLLMLSAEYSAGHLSGPNGVDYYVGITPDATGVSVLVDVHFGEIRTASVSLRLDRNRNGELEPGEIREYYQRATPIYCDRLDVRIQQGETIRPLPLVLIPGSNDTACVYYIVKTAGQQRTLRMRWMFRCTWPDDRMAQPKEPFVLLVNLRSAEGGQSCQFATGPVQPPFRIMETDIPTMQDQPLPPDITAPISVAANVPVISSGRLTCLLDGSSSGRPSPEITEIAKEATVPGPRPPVNVDPRMEGAVAAAPKTAASPPPAGRVERSESFIQQSIYQMLRDQSGAGSRWVILFLCAFWGALHAFTPGHGKAIAGAYLLGSAAKYRHALFLGGMVTLTHTAVVVIVALAAVAIGERFVFPVWLQPVGTVIVMLVGINQIRIGTSRLMGRGDHVHTHKPGRLGGWIRRIFARQSRGHNEPITRGNLVAVGLSGGLVPCPAAIVLLLLSWQLKVPVFGLICIVSFSLGLAATLSGVGVLAVSGTQVIVRWAKSGSASDSPRSGIRVEGWMPLLGGIVLVVLGVILLVGGSSPIVTRLP